MAKIYCKSSYLLRRDTAANWKNKNPILRKGEQGLETDTGIIKIGDGVTAFNSLSDDNIYLPKRYANSTFANALKGSKSGSAILIDDISPVTHEMSVKISSDTVEDLTAVKVSRCGKNLFSLANRTWANFGDSASTTVRNISKDNFYFKITANNYAINSTTNYEILNGNSIKITTTNAYGLGVPFHLIAGQQYTISCIQSDDIKCRINIGYYDIEGNYLSGEYDISTFTMPENAFWAMLCFAGFINSGTAEELTFTNIQLELGTTATNYEPYKECAEYTPTADGTVNGVTSLYPNTTLTTDTAGVIIDCEYNRDINKAFAELQQAIISLGGNV